MLSNSFSGARLLASRLSGSPVTPGCGVSHTRHGARAFQSIRAGCCCAATTVQAPAHSIATNDARMRILVIIFRPHVVGDGEASPYTCEARRALKGPPY